VVLRLILFYASVSVRQPFYLLPYKRYIAWNSRPKASIPSFYGNIERAVMDRFNQTLVNFLGVLVLLIPSCVVTLFFSVTIKSFI
jgi:hypothetical protein